ncbi:MAG TPA: SDR family NAD(P)-dependent oxidoreductase [Stellaceae bacterium]|nr:SDR family NAD(P)-dependent oxidoreductase [Stellaceae bacterium]
MIDLTGRVVLVPGANGGIGAHIARVFAECGADVALAYHAQDDEARAALAYAETQGRRARLDRVDATDAAAVKAWVDDVGRGWGRIDVLASGVGARAEGGFSLFAEQSPASWRATIDAQLMSFINLAHAVVGPMSAQKSGRILSIGSDGGKVGQSGAAVASAAHGGLIAFAKALAREVGRLGIAVNIVCPGPTEGRSLDDLRAQGNTGSRIVEEMIRRVPLKRAGTARELAATMAFLASDHGGYITGQAISVSGGLTMS